MSSFFGGPCSKYDVGWCIWYPEVGHKVTSSSQGISDSWNQMSHTYLAFCVLGLCESPVFYPSESTHRLSTPPLFSSLKTLLGILCGKDFIKQRTLYHFLRLKGALSSLVSPLWYMAIVKVWILKLKFTFCVNIVPLLVKSLLVLCM
jgi:hypothetical protein